MSGHAIVDPFLYVDPTWEYANTSWSSRSLCNTPASGWEVTAWLADSCPTLGPGNLVVFRVGGRGAEQARLADGARQILRSVACGGRVRPVYARGWISPGGDRRRDRASIRCGGCGGSSRSRRTMVCVDPRGRVLMGISRSQLGGEGATNGRVHAVETGHFLSRSMRRRRRCGTRWRTWGSGNE